MHRRSGSIGSEVLPREIHPTTENGVMSIANKKFGCSDAINMVVREKMGVKSKCEDRKRKNGNLSRKELKNLKGGAYLQDKSGKKVKLSAAELKVYLQQQFRKPGSACVDSVDTIEVDKRPLSESEMIVKLELDCEVANNSGKNCVSTTPEEIISNGEVDRTVFEQNSVLSDKNNIQHVERLHENLAIEIKSEENGKSNDIGGTPVSSSMTKIESKELPTIDMVKVEAKKVAELARGTDQTSSCETTTLTDDDVIMKEQKCEDDSDLLLPIVKHEPIVDVQELEGDLIPNNDNFDYDEDEYDGEVEMDVVFGLDDKMEGSENSNEASNNDLFVAELPKVKRDGQDKKLYPCKICNKVYSHYKSRYRHMWLHKGERPYNCFTCKKGFMSKSHLRDHVRTHTGEKPFKCTICDKSFIVNSSLQTHMRVHTGEKPFACDMCDERFVYRDRLIVHKRKHTGEKPFTCDLCSKKLTSKYLLNLHMRAHLGMKPFKCDHCDKSFVLKRKLNVHVRIHSTESSFKCSECGKVFSENYRLTAHMRTHTNERPFPCTLCGKSFKENGVLTSHMKIHLGEKPFRCEVCNKCFYDKSQLNKHLKCHSGVKPYTCTICDGKFSRHQSVVRHMKLHSKGTKIRKKTIKVPDLPEIKDTPTGDILQVPDFEGFSSLNFASEEPKNKDGEDPLGVPEDVPDENEGKQSSIGSASEESSDNESDKDVETEF